MKIIVFGASGTGTTTLAHSISEKLNGNHLDVDDYYWEKTTPPFQAKIPLVERNNKLRSDYSKYDKVVISGSLVTWSEFWLRAFDLAVFLRLPQEVRMNRLRKREMERYGDALNTNQAIQNKSKAFLEWAAKYEDKAFVGRSILQHENWMKALTCESIRITGDLTNQQRLQLVIEKMGN